MSNITYYIERHRAKAARRILYQPNENEINDEINKQFLGHVEGKEEDSSSGDGYGQMDEIEHNSFNSKSTSGVSEPVSMPEPLLLNATPMKKSVGNSENSSQDLSDLPQVLGFSRKSSLDCIPSTIRRHHASSTSYTNLEEVVMDDLTVCVPLEETMHLKFDSGSGKRRYAATTAVSQIVATVTLLFAVVLYINHKIVI